MYKVQNTRNGKFVKNAITGKTWMFDTIEAAEKMASSMHRKSVLDATAWNNVRAAIFVVLPA